MKKRTLLLTIILVSLLLIISAIFLFFPIGNMGKFSVLLFKKRVLKWAVILLVSLCVSISTISFQTIVQNRFLTPGVLGIESVFCIVSNVGLLGTIKSRNGNSAKSMDFNLHDCIADNLFLSHLSSL